MGGRPPGHRALGNRDFCGRAVHDSKNHETPNSDKDKTMVTRRGGVDHGLRWEG
jgi:hypothetical protein